MANYGVNNLLAGSQQAISSAFKTIVVVTAATSPALKRVRWYDFEIGQDGSPADNVITWDISRQTNVGTATSATPNAIDPADGAAVSVGAVNATGEGTITASSSVWTLPPNQRASYRWQVNLGSGQELISPATNLNGLALRAKAASYTGTVVAQLYFNE